MSSDRRGPSPNNPRSGGKGGGRKEGGGGRGGGRKGGGGVGKVSPSSSKFHRLCCVVLCSTKKVALEPELVASIWCTNNFGEEVSTRGHNTVRCYLSVAQH